MRIRRKEEPHVSRTLHMSDDAFAEYLRTHPGVKVVQELPLKMLVEPVTPKEPTASKWGNHKTEVDGYVFHSKKEADRYCVLRVWQQHKIIHNLSTQHDDRKKHTWVLFKGERVRGKKQRNITYVDDFQYIQSDTGLLIVEDVKSSPEALPKEFKDKAKMFRQLYPHVNFFINYDIRGWYTPER